MRFFRILPGLAAGLVCFSLAGHAATATLASLLVDTDGGRVAATVTERGTGKGLLRQLSISCDGKCELEPYVEEVSEPPLGLFRLSDVTDNLVTTWVGGVAYVVRVYALSSTKVRKVLDVHSRGQPEFYMDDRGRDHIRIFVTASERTIRIVQQDWVWTGSKYVRAKRK